MIVGLLLPLAAAVVGMGQFTIPYQLIPAAALALVLLLFMAHLRIHLQSIRVGFVRIPCHRQVSLSVIAGELIILVFIHRVGVAGRQRAIQAG